MSEKMRAVDIKGGVGPSSALFINSDTPRPAPKPHEALVRVKAFGLNRADTLQREGKYVLPPGISKIMGLEFSGTIEKLGDAQGGDEHWKVGDEVFGIVYGGAYAEYVAVSTHMLCRKPAELSWEECAGMPETWFTALQAIHLLGHFDPAGKDKSILWHAGASSVSIAGIQLCKTLSDPPAKVYATTRSDDKCDFCVNTLGATAAFNTTTKSAEDKDWADEILKATDGRGVDVIIDFVGASYFQGNLKAAARDARIILLGAMGGTKLPDHTDIGALLWKRIRIEGSTLRTRDEEYQRKIRDLMVKEVIPNVKDGKFKVHIEKVLPWEQIQDAHDLMESNKTKGKLICTIGVD